MCRYDNRPDTARLSAHRHKRVRGKISGTPERPRLNVFRSERISMPKSSTTPGITLAAASTVEKEIASQCDGTKNDASQAGGQDGRRARHSKGINTWCLTAAATCYHGRVQALAEGAREGGLDF